MPDRVPFFLQTLVNRSERLAIGWAVRAPFPSGPALHPEVRYAFESGWLPFMQSPFGLTVGFIEKTRCVSRGAEMRILDTKTLRQASNLELLR